MDFRLAIGIISAHLPSLNLGDAIALADGLVSAEQKAALNIEDVNSVSEFALTLPEVCEYARAGKKIHAIKELRVKTGCSLKVAKDAIETGQFALRHPGMIPSPWNGTF